jgi:hypothetical protein
MKGEIKKKEVKHTGCRNMSLTIRNGVEREKDGWLLFKEE